MLSRGRIRAVLDLITLDKPSANTSDLKACDKCYCVFTKVSFSLRIMHLCTCSRMVLSIIIIIIIIITCIWSLHSNPVQGRVVGWGWRQGQGKVKSEHNNYLQTCWWEGGLGVGVRVGGLGGGTLNKKETSWDENEERLVNRNVLRFLLIESSGVIRGGDDLMVIKTLCKWWIFNFSAQWSVLMWGAQVCWPRSSTVLDSDDKVLNNAHSWGWKG